MRVTDDWPGDIPFTEAEIDVFKRWFGDVFYELLDLDGQVLVVDPECDHWVKFVVTGVPASPQKPHSLDCSLTLHGPSGERLVGFDNAHPVGRGRRGKPMHHRHRLRTVKPYAYEDAATLLADFWQAADAVLKERGVTWPL